MLIDQRRERNYRDDQIAQSFGDTTRNDGEEQAQLGDFISQKFDEVATDWFAQFAEKNARKESEKIIQKTVTAPITRIKINAFGFTQLGITPLAITQLAPYIKLTISRAK